MNGDISHCRCPGGQVVCTSVEEDELCVNGMSFSKRQSKWANSALVASVDPRESFLGDSTSSPKDLLEISLQTSRIQQVTLGCKCKTLLNLIRMTTIVSNRCQVCHSRASHLSRSAEASPFVVSAPPALTNRFCCVYRQRTKRCVSLGNAHSFSTTKRIGVF